jgi:hypothetical protein
MAECEREKLRLLEKGIMLGCMYESDNGVPYGRKGESDGCNQTKASEALGVPRIKPCICRGLGVCETRFTEFANALIMPRVEHRVRCDVCGRATHWYEDGGKAEAEWNAVAGIRDECNRLE